MLRNLSRVSRLRVRSSSSSKWYSVLAGGQLAGNDYHYEEVKKNFRWNIPEKWNFTADVIDNLACSAEDKDRLGLWLVSPDRQDTKLTFHQLSTASQKAANLLKDVGATRVACILPRLPEWWIVNLATIRASIILLPCNPKRSQQDILARIMAAELDCIIGDSEVADKVDNIPADLMGKVKTKILVGGEREETGWLSWDRLFSSASETFPAVRSEGDDVMQIFYTSGTTGKPKMVAHTHSSYGYCHLVTGHYWQDLTKDDVIWSISDPGWAMGSWSTLFGPWSQGSTVFIHGMKKFRSQDVLETLQNFPISVLCAPPSLYRNLVQHDLRHWTFGSLRHCVSAGEPLEPETIYNWEEGTHHMIKQGYGQTESTLLIGNFKKMNKWIKPGSMGKAAPGYDVRIVNNMGLEVARGEQGNIGVRVRPETPPGLFKGYMEDAVATSNCFVGDFYLTGDRGVQDEDGYFWYFSRRDELIISSGYRIGPFEVESALIEHEAVKESAVVASPDVDRGQVVKAFVVLSDKFSHVTGDEEKEKELKEELQSHVINLLDAFKYPRKMEFVETLPKTLTGKVMRNVLKSKEFKKC